MPRQILDLLLVDLGNPSRPGQTLLGILAVLESQAVDRHQLLPGSPSNVDRLQQSGGRHARLGIFQQILQNLNAGRVVRIPLQNLAEILESALAVGQLNPLDLRQPEAQLDVFLSLCSRPNRRSSRFTRSSQRRSST